MRALQFLVVFFFVSNGVFSQTNKWQVDAGLSFGMALPQGEHKYSESSIRATQYALPGWNFRFDCHSGLSNGWKVGLTYSRYHSNIATSELSARLLGTVDTNGFAVMTRKTDGSFYESAGWSVQLAKDISSGRILITPQFALGIATLLVGYSVKYDMKQIGTNYSKEVLIEADSRNGVGFLISTGVKLGYTFDINGHRFCLFALGEYYGYRCATALKYTTTDILENANTNFQWFTGDVKYAGLNLGMTYFVK